MKLQSYRHRNSGRTVQAICWQPPKRMLTETALELVPMCFVVRRKNQGDTRGRKLELATFHEFGVVLDEGDWLIRWDDDGDIDAATPRAFEKMFRLAEKAAA